jgi:Tfp pilus assembly protein PilF
MEDDIEALMATAAAHREADRLEEAKDAYRAVLARQPDHPDALHLLGVLIGNDGELEAGMAMIRRAIRRRHPTELALFNLGNMALAARRYDEALACFNRMLIPRPDDVRLLLSRAVALNGLYRHTEALEACEAVLARHPGLATAWNNRGEALAGLGCDEAALASFETAVQHDRGLAGAHFSASMRQLALGDFANGWARYEWRAIAHRPNVERSFARPQWFHSDKLDGKRILLHAEQGYGDIIQFCRYAPLIAARGAHVVLEVPPALTGLMRRLAGVAEVFAQGDVLPDVHTHSPLMSLPLEFATRLDSIPADIPYLSADPARVAQWAARLGPPAGPPPPGPSRRRRIGLAWSGNPDAGRKRHIPLAALAPLLALDADFFPLQTTVEPADRKPLAAAANLHDLTADIADFDDVAALAALCDLVVSVDTAAAHLAGAMGRPLYLLLPHAADWRWLRQRDDSPWYPTARLFRQTTPGDWPNVVRRILETLPI